jgi:hypothetical protein
MSSLSLEKVNTKLEAYKLVHDPTRLLCLLYSKYGDIEEDYYLSYTNQIFYNVSSHLNIIYKENQYIDNFEEFLKRFYRKRESIERVPKLSDYYKNYLKFFCRPFFKNYKLAKLLHDYEDKKAEIFYKNNYADSVNDADEKEKENSDKKSSSSLSSLDNITNNKIIFDKRTKKIIDNNLNNDLCTLTLTLDSAGTNLIKDNNNNNLYNGCLISKRSDANSSFEKNIYTLVHYKIKKKIENKNKKTNTNNNRKSYRKKKLVNSPSSHPPYIIKIYKKKNNINQNNITKDILTKNKKINNSLYTLAKKNYIKSNCFIAYKNDKGFLSPKIIKHNINFNSKLEEFNKNRPINYNNYIHNSAKKNKTYNNTNNINGNNNNNNNTKISKAKNSNGKIYNGTNTNSIYKNFSNLSESLNKYKKNIANKNGNNTYSNKNNSGISKSKKNTINSTNLLIKSNNNDNNKRIKKKINNINKTANNNIKVNNINKNCNMNINLNINKPQFRHAKNKTFDFNTINQNEPLMKYNTNNNFDNFKALLSNNNKNNSKRNKKSSNFNLVKKPISEVMKNNPILSPQLKKAYNKMSINQSISQNKEKNNKIFYGISSNNSNSNSNNFCVPQNKYEYESPKGNFSNKKKSSMTFSSEDNKMENLNIEGIIKKNKKQNKSKNNKQIKKKKNNKYNLIKGNNLNNNNWKIQTSCLSPLSNYITNLNHIVKNKNYSSFNNTIKMDNSSSNNKNNNSEALKSTKKISNNNNNNIITNIDNCINNINNINNNKFINNNKGNNEFIDGINMSQNDNFCIFSRNKKQNTSSKISNTQSQNELNIKDIQIKSIKNLKANCIGSKTNLKNMTCTNDSNYLMPKYNINYNLNKINSSTELKNNHIKDILFKLNKISIKKKSKKNSQRISKIKENNKFYIKPKKKYKNNRAMLSNDNIFNRKKVLEIKQNSLHIDNRTIHKDNNNAKSNNTISHRDRGNSFQIINVNRNIHLINKNDQKNIQKAKI